MQSLQRLMVDTLGEGSSKWPEQGHFSSETSYKALPLDELITIEKVYDARHVRHNLYNTQYQDENENFYETCLSNMMADNTHRTPRTIHALPPNELLGITHSIHTVPPSPLLRHLG